MDALTAIARHRAVIATVADAIVAAAAGGALRVTVGPHIIVDYLDPHGPVIHHIEPPCAR
ncbi:hypothetical protein [Dactylosporangium sp. CA-092794]|uniref:hypothetical protein n=1 Tax=Dactylosporangium sp. CA-092794 TaxID=3239929 RepID=UPI003D93A9AD